jgi:hydroxymethylpyrimidine pyrophosphatase-like HAD family hydrolase
MKGDMQVESSYPPNKMRIFVFDYDGTLTMDDGKIPEKTRIALAELYDRKLALLGIVSGRDVNFLKQINGSVGSIFSFLVAENGAVFCYSGEDELVVRGRDWSQEARTVFSDVDFHIQFFEVIGSSRRENATAISQVLKESHLDSRLVLNKDSVMVCPPQVDKGTGVAEAIEHYASASGSFVVCFGDGENDVALFGPADLRIAVSNAVEELKKIADIVTTKPGGEGIAEYLTKTFKIMQQ